LTLKSPAAERMMLGMCKTPRPQKPLPAGEPLDAAQPEPRRNRPHPHDDVPIQPDPDVPHWVPTGDRWNGLPEEIRRAVPRILAPAYRRFVLDAPGELERSVGLTLVHLMWLEVCDQVYMAIATADPTSLDAILKNPEEMIDRHLNLVTAKCQTAELLVKLRLVSEALERPAPTTPSSPLRAPNDGWSGEGPGLIASSLPLGEGLGAAHDRCEIAQ
jgi:hypothetical protein